MKLFFRIILVCTLWSFIFPASSQIKILPSLSTGTADAENLKKLVEYLKNLGRYLGYDITQEGRAPKDNLLSPSFIQLTQLYAFNTLLGAKPVNAFSEALARLFPSAKKAYESLNIYANYTFKSPPYNVQARDQGGITVTPLIDQQTYQPDPVTQAILNMLSTPDKTYCMDYEGKTWNENCKLLYQSKVMANVLGGELPKPTEFFSYKFNEQVLPQLNSNVLLGPYLYSLESIGGDQKKEGLVAENQAQAAANFIRYAASIVNPPPLPTLEQYNKLYYQAKNADNEVSRKNAEAALTNYLTSLRVFAAQSSVGLSNLYYMLSKRMPQNVGGTQTNNTSQALSEFTMATWRLNNPEESAADKQWVNQLNQASPATIQKEIAILLAEINYQLYLSRQQNERLLLTNSILLLQNARNLQPSLGSFQPVQ